MRILFMGTPEFAVPCLEALARWKPGAVIGVISQPDKPRGRGMTVAETPVKTAALRLGLPVFQPARIKGSEAEQLLEHLAPQLVVVVAYGKILPKWFLDFPVFGAINVHASLLPRYRGAAPLQHAILNGEVTTGVTLMLMDEEMDTGPIISQMEFPIYENETAGELAERVSIHASEFLVRELPHYLSKDQQPAPQNPELATYAPPLKKEDGQLRFERSSLRLHNQVRAMNPWPIAFCRREDELLLVHRSYLPRNGHATGVPGELIYVNEDSMLVQCGNGVLALYQVQAPGKRIVSGRDFANGFRLKPGFRFMEG
ncbi:MAG TPA: methionyl-tRNA formyltransferase [Acidobacteriota bacterium]|jgi:methionyl-tRNA formyltransferase|nr:methionyl-tRNA formyltransferase [Acidobacteriota bacterium]